MTDNNHSSTGGEVGPMPGAKGPPAPRNGRWAEAVRGRLICIDWGRWLSSGRHVDPYLVWADLSSFAGFGGWRQGTPAFDEAGGKWPFLVEMEVGANDRPPPADGGLALALALAEMEIPGVYRTIEDASRDGLRTRFVTARVAPDSIAQLIASSAVRRLQLGLPRLPSTNIERASRTGFTSGEVPRTVIGIIDDGCAFAHPAFCNFEGRTRVHFLWDQDARRPADGTVWRRPAHLGYGAELWHECLAQASSLAAAKHDEEAAYKLVNYGPVRVDLDRHGTMFDPPAPERPLPAGTMQSSTHGAGAMYLAAGVAHGGNDQRPLASQRALGELASAPPTGAGGFVDSASRWPIIFVQLPTRTVLDTSGGSLGVHVLDGLRYIMDRADCLPYDRDPQDVTRTDTGSDGRAERIPTDINLLNHQYDRNRLVVNISYGALAGPHDGTSIIEQAMADIVRTPRPDDDSRSRRDNTWICVAAGNGQRTRTQARLSLPPGISRSLLWQVPPDNPLQSFLEVWMPDSDAAGVPLDPDYIGRMLIHVTPPGGLPGRQLRCGQAWLYEVDNESGGREVVAGAVFSRRVAQGLRGTMVLLAAAATQRPLERPDTALAPHGGWIVEVTNHNGESQPGVDPGRELIVHAWAERNDLQFGNRRRQQATVEAEDRIAEPSEYTPLARLYFGQTDWPWLNPLLPDMFQPKPSFGTLAGAASRKSKPDLPFFLSDELLTGQVVAVGGLRLADGEVPAYSSGGPDRHAPHAADRRPSRARPSSTSPVYAATGSDARALPDVNAASDIGPAVAGLRVIGMRSGSVARLSGTSAAAPSVARMIANLHHARSWQKGAVDALAPDARGAAFGASRHEDLPTGEAGASRPTPTPAADDAFRRGRWRVR